MIERLLQAAIVPLLWLAVMLTAAGQQLIATRADALGNPLTYADGGTAEITGLLVTMEPGERTGWHSHPVPTFGYLLAGELTVDYATGDTRVYRAGEVIVEAQHTPHDGHSSGSEAARLVVFIAGAPGVPTREAADPPRPDSFVELTGLIPDLVVEQRYFGSNNFTGRPVTGYEANLVYLTRPAAAALVAVEHELAGLGLGLKVFDGYRPQRAVDDFVAWAADPLDTAKRSSYYPTLDKSELIPQGYIAARSGHSRGSTIDLTLIRLDTREELDMGSPYDFFGPISWPTSELVTEDQRAKRFLLREVMLRHGFAPLAQEWWHFTLVDEPYPNTYFDFPIR